MRRLAALVAALAVGACNGSSSPPSPPPLPPAAPVLVTPAGPVLTNTDALDASGTCPAGTTVGLLLDGAPVAETACAGGAFAASVPLPDPDGISTLTAVALYQGRVSAPSAGVAIVVDRTPPAAPSLNAPAPGTATTATSLAVSGTAEEDAAVTVLVDATAAATTTSTGGAFSTSIALPGADGIVALAAVAVDLAGNASDPSAATTVEVDRTPPALVISGPLEGAVLGPAQAANGFVSIVGTTEPGLPVTVVVGDRTLGAGRSGPYWHSFVQLVDGAYVGTVTTVDRAGNPASATVSFSLDLTRPQPPVVEFPANGSIISASDAPGGFVTVTGTAELGAEIEVRTGGTSVIATRSGSTFSATFALEDGTYAINAWATDAGGNRSTWGASSFTLDTVPPVAGFYLPAPGEVFNAGGAPGGRVVIAGTIELGASIEVTLDGVARAPILGPPIVWPPTSWISWSLDVTVADGVHVVTAVVHDAAGNPSDPATLTFTVDATPPAVAISSPAQGARLGAAAAPGGSVTFSGTAEPGASVDLWLGGPFVPPVTRSGAGWTVTVTLEDGPHAATLYAVDAVQNISTTAVSFIVDTTAPGAPVLAAPVSPTSAATVAISGTAEAGALVRVFHDAELVGTATAAGGAFSVDVALTDGTHVLTATAADAAGNVSAVSAPVSVTVDRGAPLPPVVLVPAQDATIRVRELVAGEVRIAGTAEASVTVTLEVDGVTTATVAAGLGGAWSATALLDSGTHAVRVRATDALANASDWSAPRTFTVDLPRTATVLADGGSRPVTTFGQTVPDLSGLGEVFPGQANTWALAPDYGLETGWGLQYSNALVLYVGTTTAPASYEGAWADLGSGRLREFPYDQQASEATFLSPRFGAADGVRTVAASDGLAIGLPPIAGTQSAYLNGTSRSVLQRALAVPGGGTYTFTWKHEAGLFTDLLLGAEDPPYEPSYEVVLRDGAGNPLGAPLFSASTLDVAQTTVSVARSGLPDTVVLSFELRGAAGSYAELDDLEVLAGATPLVLDNPDFESGLDGWIVPDAAECQNVRSAPRDVGVPQSRLRVTRTFYAPPGATWARLVDVFENTGSSPVATSALYLTQLTGAAPQAAVRPGTVVAWGTGGNDLGLVGGIGTALVPPPGEQFVLLVHDLSVLPGGRVALVHFLVQLGVSTPDVVTDPPVTTDAECAAIAAGFWDVYAYLDDLEAGVLSAVVNF